MKCICLRGEIHLLACLFALCQLRNFLHEFTEKSFAVFDQSSHAIYLTWYWLLLFFQEFSSVTHFMVWLFFNWKLNILSFIFFIWTEQFFIWSSRKLTKNVEISIVLKSFPYFTPCMTLKSWFRSINQ